MVSVFQFFSIFTFFWKKAGGKKIKSGVEIRGEKIESGSANG